MSLPDALAAFAEPPTTTVTILEIKIDAILASDIWGLRHPSSLSIHPSRNEPWTILTVSVFLNELDATWHHISRSLVRSRAIRNANPGIYVPFAVECKDITVDRWLQVKLFTGAWTFEVEASWELITGE
jgi:hypothetical protein